jgi:hypothetical protein
MKSSQQDVHSFRELNEYCGHIVRIGMGSSPGQRDHDRKMIVRVSGAENYR